MAFQLEKWGDLYYALLESSMDKIPLCKNIHVDDWIAKKAIIASNGSVLIGLIKTFS